MKYTLWKGISLLLLLFIVSCAGLQSGDESMVALLNSINKSESVSSNSFASEARLTRVDSLLKYTTSEKEKTGMIFFKSVALLQTGDERRAIEIMSEEIEKNKRAGNPISPAYFKNLAIAWMRLGERQNCILDHSGASCVFPIAGRGVHLDPYGSRNAIKIFQELLTIDSSDLESRWLMNIAYMTVNDYPSKVPPQFLIPGLETDTSHLVKPFLDMAMNTGLNTKNMAGGAIIEDFNNDGYEDIVTSGWDLKEGMHYCRNNRNGTFSDVSEISGLKKFTGGLNIMQTDYNNDGLKDIFILRGAWKGKFGKEPNSLLRNNGDGTFTDVTEQSGLLSFHPTQTAAWSDFNNDGWLDLFIGNETDPAIAVESHPCELYINNKNGTFTEIAKEAGCKVSAFVKGVTSGDFNNDGLTDLFLSTMNGRKILFKNITAADGKIKFQDVSMQAGLDENRVRTFPTWFWDYDNDGWLDILICGYDYGKSLATNAAEEALHRPVSNAGMVFLFRNKHDGSFEDLSVKSGLNKVAYAMGSNFGDIDNDGYLDIYLGTGNPPYQSLIPNKMFKNIDGKKFVDVTTSARVGNLQKGHAVSFADLDNDGNQDIYIEMGGAYPGDAYQSSLYINPGQNDKNHWINLKLEGVTSNKAAIGAKIRVSFTENGIARSVYRDVNSGGSFGSNPLMQHIGTGQASVVEKVEIFWPASKTTQLFTNIQTGQYLTIREGEKSFTKYNLDKTPFSPFAIGCAPL